MKPNSKAVLTVKLSLSFLAFAGVLLFAVSLIEFDKFTSFLMSYAADGKIDRLTPDFFSSLVNKARVGAFLVFGLVVLGFKKQVVLSDHLFKLFLFVIEFLSEVRKIHCSLLASEKIILGLLVLFGLGIRSLYLFEPIRADEAYSFLYFSSVPSYIGLSTYTPNNHVLFNFIVHFFTYFGDSPAILRLPALFFGVALIPLSFLVGRQIFKNTSASLLAAALVSSSSYLIEYSSLARGYTLVSVFFLLAVWIALKISSGGTPDLSSASVCLGIVVALGIFSVPVMVYPAGGIFLYMLLSSRRNISFVGLSLGVTAVTSSLLYGPILVSSGLEALLYSKHHVTSLPFKEFLFRLPNHVSELVTLWARDVTLLGALVFLGLAVVGGFSKSMRYLSFGILLWVIPVLFLQRVIPYQRIWIPFLPYFLLCISGGFLLLPVRKLLKEYVAGLLWLLLCISIFLNSSIKKSHQSGSFRDANEIAKYISKNRKKGDRVVTKTPATSPIRFYLQSMNSKELVRDLMFGSSSEASRFLVVLNLTDRQNTEWVMRGQAKGNLSTEHELLSLPTGKLVEVFP